MQFKLKSRNVQATHYFYTKNAHLALYKKEMGETIKTKWSLQSCVYTGFYSNIIEKW